MSLKSFSQSLCRGSNLVTTLFDFLASFFALGIRLYLASVFLWSGWLKISDWSTTLSLFQYEYKVPLLSPTVAAYFGTGAELIFGTLILVGFCARLSALGLLLTNILMIYAYPILLTPEGACMVKDHYLWCVLISVILFYGPGRISLDYLIKKKMCKEYKY